MTQPTKLPALRQPERCLCTCAYLHVLTQHLYINIGAIMMEKFLILYLRCWALLLPQLFNTSIFQQTIQNLLLPHCVTLIEHSAIVLVQCKFSEGANNT